ncbi:MAG TPA: heme o synthase [Candidatus Angelobacter sp.]|jgi:protoheme IX farnesyltransferase|nr:heme o synthase [Candidatus Angelobacter sp.]
MSSIPQRLEQETTVAATASSAPVVLKKNSLLGDYFQLFKVRVTSLVVMTAWAGYYMGAVRSGVSSLTWTLLNALVGIGVTCAGSAALNEVLEHKIDALMRRTRNRPLPAGRMSLATGLTAGILATVLGPVYLSLTTNVLTGVLAFSTAATYLAFYTPLKRISPISTFVGAFPGAMPPLLGWTAVRGKLEIEAVLLFLIVFFWQFPHFQAIAWMYREDYEAAGIKMLPVVDKAGHAVIRQMLTYCSTLISVSMVPTLLRMTGRIYLFGALVLGMGFLWFVVRLARTKLPTTSPDSRLFARQLLQASVIYLPLLFALMMLNVVHS